MAHNVSLKVPFQIAGGKVCTTSDHTAINEQKIINVLVTGKFERPMIPDYGAGVQSLLFDAIDELVEVDFKTDAVQEVLARVSGLNILDVTVKQTDESEATITVYYRTPMSSVQSTSFNVAIPATLTEESPL